MDGVMTMALQRKGAACSRPVKSAMTADMAATTKKPDVQDNDSISSRTFNHFAGNFCRRITPEITRPRERVAVD